MKATHEEKLILTKEQAISLLPVGETVHTFRNPNGMIIGADWGKDAIIKAINQSGEDDLEIGGEMCKRMGHALIIWDNGPLFVECNMDAVEVIESQQSN